MQTAVRDSIIPQWQGLRRVLSRQHIYSRYKAVVCGSKILFLLSRTYGKGLIQSVYELSDSSGLVLTVGKYLTPLRTDIDREGLKPDFRHMPSSSAAAEQLQACRLSHQA